MTRLFPLITLLLATGVQAQNLDLLIRNGHVIDPKNGIDAVMDVGIVDGKIAEVAAGIPVSRAETVVDATGLYVTPGLIDLHAHVFHGTEEDAYISNSYTSVPPDAFTFRSGVTTAVDVGSAGWRNLRQFIEQTVEHSDTRILAFLNIVGSGMKGGTIEQNLADMDSKLTAMTANRYRDVVVGVKLAHYMGHEWGPTDRAVEAGRQADIPVMIDFGGADPRLSIRELFFDHLRPGDIFTHAYANLDSRESVVDEQGRLRPFVLDAQKRGIVFDVGHGGGSFMYSAALPATRAGLWPNTISTDLHTGSMNAGMKDITNVMSKFLNLGMSLKDVVAATTSKPAEIIKRPALGNLDVGAEADVAVIRLREGVFGFVDTRGFRVPGRQKLETELTVRAGKVVWDLNGISRPAWTD
ncbi:MAG: amidohydrolase/deacetylase family metallohydrolase [Rhodothermales bacterium]